MGWFPYSKFRFRSELYYNHKAYTSKIKKLCADPADKDRPKNIRILRYADILLMNAEAGSYNQKWINLQ